ncbi:hypothetical protein C8F01DRAFT_1150698 [Mycena amicta]|nr:hypothetical protein C8F01DRAFT_1150698 [Mycena amicta]
MLGVLRHLMWAMYSISAIKLLLWIHPSHFSGFGHSWWPFQCPSCISASSHCIDLILGSFCREYSIKCLKDVVYTTRWVIVMGIQNENETVIL